jgi:hypothetical protein
LTIYTLSTVSLYCSHAELLAAPQYLCTSHYLLCTSCVLIFQILPPESPSLAPKAELGLFQTACSFPPSLIPTVITCLQSSMTDLSWSKSNIATLRSLNFNLLVTLLKRLAEAFGHGSITCHLSTWEAGGSWIRGQPGIYSKTLSQKNKK